MTARQGNSTVGRHEVAGTDAGFSLLEVLVSFVIFAVVAAVAGAAIVTSLQASHTTQQRVDAANIAQSFISSARSGAQTAANGTATFSPGVTNEDFTVVRTISFLGSATACSPGASFTVNVVVSQKQSGQLLARSDSVIAC